MKPHLQVGIALIVQNGYYLIAQRKPDVHLGGCGNSQEGNAKRGESLAECVSREVLEELDIEVSQPVHFLTNHHDYAEKTVELNFLNVQLSVAGQGLWNAQIFVG